MIVWELNLAINHIRSRTVPSEEDHEDEFGECRRENPLAGWRNAPALILR
jgi:hypothetical protein